MELLWIAVVAAAAAAVFFVLRKRPRRSAAVRTERAVGTLDEAVQARAAGDLAKARAILDGIDVAKGGGLRRLMRAIATYESGDEAGARALGDGRTLPGGVPTVMCRLQVWAALGRPDEIGGDDAISALARALAAKQAKDDAALRRAMAALLFSDPDLAALVLAKELGTPAPSATPRAAERYASIARGRDLFVSWGPERVAGFLAFWEST